MKEGKLPDTISDAQKQEIMREIYNTSLSLTDANAVPIKKGQAIFSFNEKGKIIILKRIAGKTNNENESSLG